MTYTITLAKLVALAALLLTVACQPMGPLPGGELTGEVQPAPTDWTDADTAEVVQLETRPSDPYSFNVWGTGIGEDYYVAAGRGNNRWVEHIAADGNVRLKIGADVYPLHAVRVDDADERARVLDKYVSKYKEAAERMAEGAADAVVYRLDPRALDPKALDPKAL